MGTHPIFESDFDCLTDIESGGMRPSEENNNLSLNIDVQPIPEMIKIFNQIDHQIFEPWPSCGSNIFETMTENISKLSHVFAAAIKNKTSVVFGGCGTSGRLGFFCARKFNRALEELGLAENIWTSGFRTFDYSLAGDDEAIFVSNEIVEDSPPLGIKDLENIFLEKKSKISAYVGITCGLSAPYVAGQLKCAMEKNLETFLIGHNPRDQAKNIKIEKWNQTFKDVVDQLAKYEKGKMILPVPGGECISGSSRMKG